jgi:hypothetical protein
MVFIGQHAGTNDIPITIVPPMIFIGQHAGTNDIPITNGRLDACTLDPPMICIGQHAGTNDIPITNGKQPKTILLQIEIYQFRGKIVLSLSPFTSMRGSYETDGCAGRVL